MTEENPPPAGPADGDSSWRLGDYEIRKTEPELGAEPTTPWLAIVGLVALGLVVAVVAFVLVTAA